MAHVSHKLKNSFEGALAGGGDPATSPLYVFGPFLRLIVVGGVAQVTFGASVWLVVITIAVVSAMYRLVMRWVTDGSGGSGLSEEEFGGWAVKVNAAITFIEYTLTFLVSMAAMVTFIADRVPILNEKILWLQYRTIVAIVLSVFTGWLVNRGPKMAARTFGPATLGVLVLLWVMVIATILRSGLHLPDFNLAAFSPEFLKFTVGGYVRILAVMTGIEVFANLVAAYEGNPAEKSRKAFFSLLIIMGTTGVTMLIVGPAIFELSDPTNMGVSVFTQTMDALLPAPLPLLGTLVGVLVLMSASAASAQGLQNLALGLKERRYVPPVIGQPNDYEVADKPVWIEVGIVSVVFFFFGTHEETYLALYAAGVFVLLSMTGWAVTKRLLRDIREDFSPQKAGLLTGTIFASLLTTGATAIIFEERFLEGAWTYFLFIPALYIVFTYFRSRLGAPSPEMEYLGRFNAAQLAGFGFGQAASEAAPGGNGAGGEFTWQPEPIEHSHWREDQVEIERMLVLLDGSDYAAQALPYAKLFSKATGARITLLSAVKDYTPALQEEFKQTATQRKAYLKKTAAALKKAGFQVDYVVRPGFIADAAAQFAEEQGIDIIVISLRGKSGADNWQRGGATQKLVHKTDKPVLLVQATDPGLNDKLPNIERILVPLDGSILSEQALPYSRNLSKALESELILLTVPVVPSSESYRAAGQVVEAIREKAEENMREFLDAVAGSLQSDGVKARALVTGSMPARTIVTVSDEEDVDLILMTSQGRGGLDLLLTGSVAGRVVQQTNVAVMIVPIIEDPNGS